MSSYAQNLDLSVYFIADPALSNRRRIEDVVDRAIRGGATCIQYRDKSGDRELIYQTACQIRDVCFEHGVPFIVNDYVDIAYEIYADGVHVGQGDMHPAEARQILGPSAIIGLTAYTPEHLAQVDSDITDYVGCGPVYETKTDKGKPVLGLDGFKALIALSPVPVVGIGGITPENAGPVIQCGAQGVAMMRAISEADAPREAAQDFVQAVRAAVL